MLLKMATLITPISRSKNKQDSRFTWVSFKCKSTTWATEVGVGVYVPPVAAITLPNGKVISYPDVGAATAGIQ